MRKQMKNRQEFEWLMQEQFIFHHLTQRQENQDIALAASLSIPVCWCFHMKREVASVVCHTDKQVQTYKA